MLNETSDLIIPPCMPADAAAEKNTRAAFKAEVDRRLSRKTVVILDALNNIKGFRCEHNLQSTAFCGQLPAHASSRHGRFQHLMSGAITLLTVRKCCGCCRYEIWCIARAVGTRSCVLHCEVPVEQCRDWNAARPDGYSAAVFDDLAGRFERPDSRSRWDAPLFECVLPVFHL